MPKGPERAIGSKRDALGTKVCALHNPRYRAGESQRDDELARSRVTS